VVVAIFFPFSFEGGGTKRTTCFLPVLFASFFLAICVHSFVEEVDSGVLRVSGPSTPGLPKAIFFSERWRLRFFLLHPDFLGACWGGLLLWRIGDAV
jgi:hypothetical protein